MSGFPTRWLAAALLVLSCLAPAAAAPSRPETPPPISFGGPFSLIDHDGNPRTERDFGERFLLVSFGYTYCPDICPTGLQTIATALDLLGRRAVRVQPLFVSVDPARDTPAALKAYVAQFHPRIIGLTGSETQVRAAAKVFRVHRSKVLLADADSEADYLVNHSSLSYLMAPDGQFITLFPHGTDAEPMAKAIAKYLR